MSWVVAPGARISTGARCRCGRRNIKPSLSRRSACSPRCSMRSGCIGKWRRRCSSSVLRSAACSKAPRAISSPTVSKESRFRYRPIITTRSSRRRIRMNWKPELDELARREAFAREMGGVDKVKRQHDQGRLTVRERIDGLIDKNSFHENGAISGIAEYDDNSELKHFSVRTRKSAMLVAGPPVVKRLGQDLTETELGGAEIQTRAGGVDDAVDTEEEAFERARRFLSYLPSSVYDLPPTTPCTDDPERAEESLLKAVPRNRSQVYKMRPIIDAVVDKGSFFEVNANFGRPVVTGLARLEGRAVLLLASDPFHYGGSWTAEACQKVVRWVDFAETFHLPVVYLMDCPGFMIGLEAEKSATIRHGVRAMAAVNQSTVPWCTIIGRNPFGVPRFRHQQANRFSIRYAWPSAYWGTFPIECGY